MPHITTPVIRHYPFAKLVAKINSNHVHQEKKEENKFLFSEEMLPDFRGDNSLIHDFSKAAVNAEGITIGYYSIALQVFQQNCIGGHRQRN